MPEHFLKHPELVFTTCSVVVGCPEERTERVLQFIRRYRDLEIRLCFSIKIYIQIQIYISNMITAQSSLNYFKRMVTLITIHVIISRLIRVSALERNLQKYRNMLKIIMNIIFN